MKDGKRRVKKRRYTDDKIISLVQASILERLSVLTALFDRSSMTFGWSIPLGLIICLYSWLCDLRFPFFTSYLLGTFSSSFFTSVICSVCFCFLHFRLGVCFTSLVFEASVVPTVTESVARALVGVGCGTSSD